MSALLLLTNDDGIHAGGILALKQALVGIGEIVVVAPDRPRSASGHSITLHKPLRVNKVRMPDGGEWYSTSGTPSDCVMLAGNELLPRKPDLVLSGINDGPNLGWDLTYSGTVAAAMEGAIMGCQAMAISLVNTGHHPEWDYTVAARFAAEAARLLLAEPLPPHVLLNVNVPIPPDGRVRGARLTVQGVRRYPGQVEKRVDPFGKTYYWLGGDLPEDTLQEGSDVHAVAEGFVSVTPVQLDLTCYAVLDELRNCSALGRMLRQFGSQ